MNSKLSLFVLWMSGWMSVVVAADQGMRIWTNRDGRTLEAKVLSVMPGKSVTVMTPAGRSHVLPLDTLSDADQAYLKTWGAQAARGGTVGKGKAEWMEDFAEARRRAGREGRAVLMLFTGSDWCPYCIQLEKNVLSGREFEGFASDNLVLMLVDFPKRKKMEESQLRSNHALAAQYKVKGYPTLVLVDESGKELSRFGYAKEDAAAFVAKVKEKLPK